mgnify:CR=1 FL=1
MKTELYYFSGTGNSIHVARELKKRIPGMKLIPVMGTLKKSKVKSNAEIIGIVFPIHGHTFPWVIKEFLKRLEIPSTSYLFAISNRECADQVFLDMNKVLKKKNRQLNASFFLNTPVNFIPIFSVPSKEEIKKLETELQKKLDIIQDFILNRKQYHENTGGLIKGLATTLLRISTFILQKSAYFGLQNSYYANDKCTGCGICERICLSHKIKLVNDQPEWDKNIACTYCFACISYCPTKAIQARWKRTKHKRRYHHPEISVKDIAEQKM